MASAYAPLPFSYLAGSSEQKQPRKGLRKDEGLYGQHNDVAKPIPALRHDQPRGGAGWRLPGGPDLNYGSNVGLNSQFDTSDANPAQFGYGARLPRPEVTYGNMQEPEVRVVDDSNRNRPVSQFPPHRDASPAPATTYQSAADVIRAAAVRNQNSQVEEQRNGGIPTTANAFYDGSPVEHADTSPTGGVFDNFILVGPDGKKEEIQPAVSRPAEVHSGADQRGRAAKLEELFQPDETSLNERRLAGPLGPIGSDRKDTKPVDGPSYQLYSGINNPAAEYSPTSPDSRPNSFGNADAYLVGERNKSSRCLSETSTGGPCPTCCKRALIVIAIVAAVIILLGVGFVAGWFAHERVASTDSDIGPVLGDSNTTASDSSTVTTTLPAELSTTLARVTSSRTTTVSPKTTKSTPTTAKQGSTVHAAVTTTNSTGT